MSFKKYDTLRRRMYGNKVDYWFRRMDWQSRLDILYTQHSTDVNLHKQDKYLPLFEPVCLDVLCD